MNIYTYCTLSQHKQYKKTQHKGHKKNASSKDETCTQLHPGADNMEKL